MTFRESPKTDFGHKIELENPDETIDEIHKRLAPDSGFVGIIRRGENTFAVFKTKPEKDQETKIKKLGKKPMTP